MFSGDFVPKICISRLLRRDLQKNGCMHKMVESMFETVCRIVISGSDPAGQAMELQDFYDGAGAAADLLDNVLYERMGMSCEEVIEALQDVIINKSCQKHPSIC